MRTDFIEKPIVLKELPKEINFDMFLLENSEKQITQICEFLQNDDKLMLVSGFKGTGKTSVVNFVASMLNPDVLTLRYNCFETTILDDMLLSFFDTFRNYTLKGQIVPPKVKTENFTQKINSYFHSITKPVVIILDSFESVLKSNTQDILNFIKHISNLSDIKIIIISRKHQGEDFEEIKYSSTAFLALSQPIYEKYLKANGIKHIGLLSNELYKHSKGYYYNVNLSVKIMNLRNWSLVQFLEKFSKSFMSFSEFITREALSLIDPVSAHLFRLLTVMRIPIHVNLLKSLHLYDSERVFFFITNSLLCVEGECLYLEESYRDVIENQIPENVMVKLHSACIDLYNTQLPLKPLERDLRLSRQTMRNEIDYHTMFIPKKPVLNLQDFRVIKPDIGITDSESDVGLNVVENSVPEETKEEKINKISFIIDDEAIGNIADSIKDFINDKVELEEIKEQSQGLDLKSILNIAKQEEAKYNWKNVILLYQSALTKKNDDNFYQFVPKIYIQLAKAYTHLSQWYEALEAYTQAQDFYFNASNFVKVNEIKLEIANIYYIIYKHDNAKYILTELENNPDLTNELRIKVNLAQAKLCDNVTVEYSYLKKSVPLVDSGMDKSVVSELYYQFAVVSDEINNTRDAVEYYKKCIDICPNPNQNKFLSMALSNLAQLYDEAGSPQHAVKYYNESMEIDKQMKNYNGLYYCAVRLSEIYSSKNTAKSFEYLNLASEYAKKLNEPFYIAESDMLLGDYYFTAKEFEQAYKFFIEAYKAGKNSFTKDNLDKIKLRIQDIQHTVSENEFNRLCEKYDRYDK